MKVHWIFAIVLLSLFLVSCATPESSPTEPPIATSMPSAENPLQSGPTLEPTEMPSTPPVKKFVSLSKKDLAGRLQIDAAEITLVKTEEIVWPNSALGCPRPEKVYPLGHVPGFQIWLEANATTYLYNTDYNGQVILCPELNPGIPNSILGPAPDIGVPIP